MIAYLLLMFLSVLLGWLYSQGDGGPLSVGTLALIVLTAMVHITTRYYGVNYRKLALGLFQSKSFWFLSIWILVVSLIYIPLERHRVIDATSLAIIVPSAVLFVLLVMAAVRKCLVPRNLVVWQLTIYLVGGIASVSLMQFHGAPTLGQNPQATHDIFAIAGALVRSTKLSLLCTFPLILGLEFLLYHWADGLDRLDRFFTIPMFHALLMSWMMLLVLPVVPAILCGGGVLSETETFVVRDLFRVFVAFSTCLISGAGLFVVGFPARKNWRIVGGALIAMLVFGLMSYVAIYYHQTERQHSLHGTRLVMMGRFPEAIGEFDKAIKVLPNDEFAYEARGDAYERLGDNEKARTNYRRALDVNPKFKQCFKRAVQLEIFSKRYKEAVELSNSMIRSDPSYGPAYSYRADAYTSLGKFEKAKADLDFRIALDPRRPWSYVERAYTNYTFKKYNDAIADANVAIKLDPKIENAYGIRGESYSELWQYNLAISDLTKTIELRPDCGAAFYQRGQAFLKLEHKELSKADLNRAAELGVQ